MTSTQSWYLLYPSSTSSSSKDVGTFYSSCTHLIFVTVAGLLGLRICTNAIRFYYFCIDWNLITQKEWADLAALHFFKQNIISRKKDIKDALITTTYIKDIQHGEQYGRDGGNSRVRIQQERQEECYTSDCKSMDAAKLSPPTSSFKASSCPICLSDFQEKEQVSRSKHVSNCNHVFHSKCLQAWLLKHNSCPVCRHQMVTPTASLPPAFDVHIPTLVAPVSQ